MEFFSGLNNSDITAFSSMLIALFALIATLYQGFITRTHNVLSLRPLVSISSQVILSRDVTLHLSNQGVGPAIITSVYYLIDNKKFELRVGEDFHALRGRMGLTNFDFDLECNLSIFTSIIPAAEDVTFLKFINVKHPERETVELNREIVMSLPKFIINYKCMYDKKYTYEWSKSLARDLV